MFREVFKMSAVVHVKSLSDWKPVKLDPKVYSDKQFDGLICVEELKDYRLVKFEKNQLHVGIGKKPNVTKKQPSVRTKAITKTRVKSSRSEKKCLHNEGNGRFPEVGGKSSKYSVKLVDDFQRTEGNKITRKKKKLLKWKLKARLKKEANVGKAVAENDPLDETEINETDLKTEQMTVNKNKKTKSKKRKNVELDIGTCGVPNKKIRVQGIPERKPAMKSSLPDKQKDMSAWKDLYVPGPVLSALSDLNFTSPMPIQALTLPSAIRDRLDIVGAAETGSGKTLAFGVPMIHHILEYKERCSRRNLPQNTEEDGQGELTGDRDTEDYSTEDSDSETEESVISEQSDKGGDYDGPAGSGGDYDDPPVDEGMQSDSDADGQGGSGEDYDNPPDDEDIGEMQGDGMGLVKVVNDVEFDWLEVNNQKPLKSVNLLGLILTPTRELAVQVKNHIEAVAKYTDIKVAVVVGGMAPQKQRRLLKRCPEIVVATPGRLWELIQEGDSFLSTIDDVRYLAIDEADRMVEKGHFEELSKLLEQINSNECKRRRRQTFVFSATLTMVHSGPHRHQHKKNKVKLTSELKLGELMRKIGVKERPKIVDLSRRIGTAETLTEAKIHCSAEEKDSYLYYLLTQYPGRTLVFANSKDCVRRLMSMFTLLRSSPLTLHADMHQKQRLKNLEKFTASENGLLLATDVAARGLDIPNVQHVIHYQVPRTTENYIHRSGRTARAYKQGLSVMLVGAEDMKNYKKIVFTLNKNEDLPSFPVEQQYFNELKSRVSLARQIDSQEHRFFKLKRQNDWFEKAARDMDMELDEDLLLNDLGDQRQQSSLTSRLRGMKEELNGLLRLPIASNVFSGKYPTKTGRLVVPKLPEKVGDAITHLNKDNTVHKKMLSKITPRTQTARRDKRKRRKH